jgi:hypothetical protein
MFWTYHDANGAAVFQHYRVNDPASARGKRYGYRYPKTIRGRVGTDWVYEKHPLADTLLYRLPIVLANPDERLVLVEGERDCCVALGMGILTSSHHGGAGHFSEAQAVSLAGHRGRIVLVADNDPAGAYDVCRRYDLLRAVGIPAKRLRVREVAPTHTGADLRDHLEAGYRLRDLRRADLDRLRDVAASDPTGEASEGSWPYDSNPGQDIKNWKPQRVRRGKDGEWHEVTS